jgi:hypothetical protein
VPGVKNLAALQIISEIGTDMSRFATDAHLISWACICPRSDESAGKRRSTRIRVTARRIAQPPKGDLCHEAPVRPVIIPSETARQLPDLSTIIRVEPSSTGDSRLQGALPIPDSCTATKLTLFDHFVGAGEQRWWNGKAKCLLRCYRLSQVRSL